MRLLLVCSLFVVAAPALALDAQVLLGRRADGAAVGRELGLSGAAEATIAAHVRPLGPLPVSVGAYATYNDYDVDQNRYDLQDLKGWTAGPEVMAWLPLGPVAPYAKLARQWYQNFDIATEDTFAEKRLTKVDVDRGTEYAFGLSLNLAPAVAVIGEYRRSLARSDARAWLAGASATF